MSTFHLSAMPLYLGIHLLFSIFLARQVVHQRHHAKIGIGTGEDPNSPLARAVRVHGNHAEYTPLVMVLLLVMELAGAPLWMLHGLGIIYTLARLAHWQGLSGNSGRSKGRFYGTACTWLCYIAGGIGCVYIFFTA